MDFSSTRATASILSTIYLTNSHTDEGILPLLEHSMPTMKQEHSWALSIKNHKHKFKALALGDSLCSAFSIFRSLGIRLSVSFNCELASASSFVNEKYLKWTNTLSYSQDFFNGSTCKR